MIKEYWPQFLQDNDKFEELDRIESLEIQSLWDGIKLLEENQFLLTADESTIARYEKMASIRARPSESLETRRYRVINKLSSYSPYNKTWLHNKLDAVLGDNKHEHQIEDDLLTINTGTDEIDAIKTLRSELRQEIPCTMDMKIGLVRASHQSMYMGAIARVCKITTITPSTEVTINVSSDHKMYAGTYVRTVKKVTIQGG